MFEIPCPHGGGWFHLLMDIALALPVFGVTSYFFLKDKYIACYSKIKKAFNRSFR